MPSPLSVLTRYRGFRNLFVAEMVVFGADWFVLIPLLTLLNDLTGRGIWGALVLATDTGINALLLPFTGVIADRLDRRKVMMGSNLAAFSAVGLLFAVRTAGAVWLALLTVGLIAVAKSFYSPSASAALPNMVDPPDLAAANAVAGSAWGTMTVVGASLGGVVAAAFNPYTCFAIAASSLALAAVLMTRIDRPMQTPRDVPARATTVGVGGPDSAGDGADSIDRDDFRGKAGDGAIREGLRYIVRRPRVLLLVTVKSAVGLGNGVLSIFPVLALAMGAGALGTGLLFAVRGAGSLVGPLVMRRVVTRRSWLLPGMAASMALYGVAYLGVSVVRWLPLVLALVMLAHLAGGGNWMMSNFALQQEVPDELRGRVFATDMAIATLAVAVSQLAVGALLDSADPWLLVACCGLVTLLYSVGWRLVVARLRLS